MRAIALVLAAAFALSIPTAAVVKAEDTTVIKKDRDFDRDKVISRKKNRDTCICIVIATTSTDIDWRQRGRRPLERRWSDDGRSRARSGKDRAS
jgi:hypothetical protein